MDGTGIDFQFHARRTCVGILIGAEHPVQGEEASQGWTGGEVHGWTFSNGVELGEIVPRPV